MTPLQVSHSWYYQFQLSADGKTVFEFLNVWSVAIGITLANSQLTTYSKEYRELVQLMADLKAEMDYQAKLQF